MSSSSTSQAVQYEQVDADYLSQRELKSGAAGWILLASLGVSYVISGDFAGWNFGLAHGGFGGMLIAVIVMAIMYLCLVFTLAELSTSLPTAGGGYSFARRALGPWGGYLTGTAILLEYAIAPAAIVIFIGSYTKELIGVDGPAVYALFYFVFVGIHLWGAGEALKIMMGITTLAVLAIVVFVVAALPYFNASLLFNIPPDSTDGGTGTWFLPFGYYGIWSAIPFAMWLFLAVEGVPLAAEEAKNPTTDLSRGMVTAMLALVVIGALVLVLVPGVAGADQMKAHGAPLVGALRHLYGHESLIAGFVNVVGLCGLIASFFSIIYAYSRQVFALSRAGYLPRVLSITGERKVPTWALIVPGVIGFLLSLTGKGDMMITMAVFGATISYFLMTLSHIVLRLKEPKLHRPFRTPGGVVTSGVACALSLVAFASTFAMGGEAALWSALFYATMVAYFGFYSRHRLVAQAPEEEFAVISLAEQS
ncbi:ethanolamine permease [Aeoliella sp. SH292]|uniref:ethanolamine permease n=1 Tax=Aeoliella sp. SH292 TaxID=3454464 RepID=UPI003F957A9F